MKIGDVFSISRGSSRSLTTPLVEVELDFKDRVFSYRRPDLGDAGQPMEKNIFLPDRKQVELELAPVYPDLPVVFKPEGSIGIPAGESGEFYLGLRLGYGVRFVESETLVEEILAVPRKKTYWGAVTEGILSYQESAGTWLTPDAAEASPPLAILPVEFSNQLEELYSVDRCLVPVRELNLYCSGDGRLIFEKVKLDQQSESRLTSRPSGTEPRQFSGELSLVESSPNPPRTLLDRVGSIPGWSQVTGVLANR